LHEVGSNNPDGVEIKKKKDDKGIPLDGIAFHPYYTVKDIAGVAVFLIVFALVIFYLPQMGGYFLEHANFIPANPLQTPEHIAPLWYFTPFYTVLRAVPDPFLGTIAMGLAVGVLFVLPWVDRNPIKSMRYRSPLHRVNLFVFAGVFVILGILGTHPATPFLGEMAVRFSEVYFLFFFVLWYDSHPRTTKFSLGYFLVLIGMITLYDWARFDASKASFIIGYWLIPAVYLSVMVLVPVFATGLKAERTVPERVTT
jgi:ubiquinol-cytochrome c reductase cytochrome b subunit